MLSNPFKPTAGKTPVHLVGRAEELDEFEDSLVDGPGAPGRLVRVSGARGMGKTVMLNEFARIAREHGWAVVEETAGEGFCERILDALQPQTRLRSVSVGPSVLGVSVGKVDIEHSALRLREAIAEKTKKGPGLLITLDEVQDATLAEMRSLAVAVQHAVREERNIAFAFAGLPSMVESVVNGKTLTFLRRALPFDLDPVDVDEVELVFCRAFQDAAFDFDAAAAHTMARETQGYPFMVQLVGYYCWRLAQKNDCRLDGQLLDLGITQARKRFDAMVIEPALQRLSPMRIGYLLAMLEDDTGASRTSQVALRIGKSQTSASEVRAGLIRDGLIEPAGWGAVRFCMPYLAEYLQAHAQEWGRGARGRFSGKVV